MVVKMTYANFNNKEKGMDYSMELGVIYLGLVLSSFGLLYMGVKDNVNVRNSEQEVINSHIITTNLEDKVD